MMPGAAVKRPQRPRRQGRLSLRGDWTLFRRGLLRYLHYSWASVGGPCVSALLFLAIFTIAAGESRGLDAELSLVAFVAPGIIIIALCHAAFENAAFSLMEDKQEGMIADLLLAPLRVVELMLGYVIPGLATALMTTGLVFLLTSFFVDYAWVAPLISLGFVAATGLFFALFGTLAALWAARWDHYSAAETFFVLPLAFLSGGFFPLKSLPEAAQLVVLANPVFHGVNGLRYGLTGHLEANLGLGALFLLAMNAALFVLLWSLFRRGYNIKS